MMEVVHIIMFLWLYFMIQWLIVKWIQRAIKNDIAKGGKAL